MIRRLLAKRHVLATATLVVIVGSALAALAAEVAAGTPTPNEQTWKTAVAAALNTGGVMAFVQILKWLVPQIKKAVPWVLPLVTVIAGPLLAWGQTALGQALGVDVDLSPLAGIVTGATATTAHQVYHQAIGKPRAAARKKH